MRSYQERKQEPHEMIQLDGFTGESPTVMQFSDANAILIWTLIQFTFLNLIWTLIWF